MLTLSDLKQQKENKVSELIKQCGMFFAFSTQQFTENKTPKKEGEKYLSIGAGAYLPKDNYPVWEKGISEINKWFKAAVKNNKLRKVNIVYELNNHEAFYTGDITETCAALGPEYSREEVLKVYISESKNVEVY